MTALIPARKALAPRLREVWIWQLMILAVAWWATPANAESKARSWEQLTGCVYLDDEYNDGDSFHVRCGDQEFFVRLYFVDAPESRMQQPERVHQQSEHFGITMDQVLRSGKDAAAQVKTRLRSPFSVWTRWARGADAPGFPATSLSSKSTGKTLRKYWSVRVWRAPRA